MGGSKTDREATKTPSKRKEAELLYQGAAPQEGEKESRSDHERNKSSTQVSAPSRESEIIELFKMS
jgi:hypothetical protein